MSETDYLRYMDEFLAAYYGGGWRYIRAYIDWMCAEAAGWHMNIWNPLFEAVSREKAEAMEETFDGWWDRAEVLAGERAEAVKRSRLQWRCLKLMLHPDEAEARRFRDDLERYGVRWRELTALPDEKVLASSPAEWL